jgi:hypothetical protein
VNEMTPKGMLHTASILAEIGQERRRQIERWGEQNHPSLDVLLVHRTPERMADEYEIPTEARAKAMTEAAMRRGELTWGHILVEELAEAVEAGVLNGEHAMRAELVQVAAVAVAWIEAIDRRTAAGVSR